MTSRFSRIMASGLLVLATAASSGAAQDKSFDFAQDKSFDFAQDKSFDFAQDKQPATGPQEEPKARPELVRQPYSEADIDFMSGMIPHHAQAVLMGGWAPTHAARPDVKVLCERMVIAQRDEIAFMRNWLRDRGEFVPAANATAHRMKMNGVEHDMLMPGMLTPEQLAQLEKARGSEWDRLFLTFMIKHHEGALKMVDDLFASYGALQDDDVYKFASDLYADQTTEIERMQKLLEELGKPGTK